MCPLRWKWNDGKCSEVPGIESDGADSQGLNPPWGPWNTVEKSRKHSRFQGIQLDPADSQTFKDLYFRPSLGRFHWGVSIQLVGCTCLVTGLQYRTLVPFFLTFVNV